MSKHFLKFVLLQAVFSYHAYSQIELEGSKVLIGGVGAAYNPSFESAQINPAISPFVSTTTIEGNLPISYKKSNIRYPGQPTFTDSGFGFGFPMIGGIIKPMNRMAISVFAVPFAVSTKIEKSGLPFKVLDQISTIKLAGTGKLVHLYDIGAAYRINKTLSLGLRYYTSAFSGSVNILNSQNSQIASVEAEMTNSFIQTGIYLRLNRAISLGLSANLNETSDSKTNMSTFADGTLNNETTEEAPTKISKSLSKARIGIAIALNSKTTISTDIEHKPKVEKKAASVVDFKVKPVDTYATTSFHFGGDYQFSSNKEIIFGAQNIPSSIGPGSISQNKIGFGITDILTNLGEIPSKPVFTLAVGLRFKHGKILNKAAIKKSVRSKTGRPDKIYQLKIESGLAYSETSIGVDDSGEQPGAYLATRYIIPIKFTYHF